MTNETSTLLKWDATVTPGATLFSNEVLPEYEISQKGTEFYAWSPGGVIECKSLAALTAAKAVDHMTVRNWRTVKKIADAF